MLHKKNSQLPVMPVFYHCVYSRKQEKKKNLYIQAQVSTCKGNNLQKLVCTVVTGRTNKLMMEGFILKKAC